MHVKVSLVSIFGSFYFTKLEKGVTFRAPIKSFKSFLNLIENKLIEMEGNPNNQEAPQNAVKEDPGLMESIGSFPVWMLKIIDVITPDFLIKKTPPPKK